MTQALSSSWVFGPISQPQATVSINTLVNDRQKPIGISFTCNRLLSGIDSKIHDVFIRAIKGEAHRDMQYNNQCSHDNVLGGCGNKRKDLSECRCEVLNRISNPEIRHSYENRVISTIINSLERNKNNFHFRLAIFCSGELLGDEILLFRLFDQLNALGAKGKIELFLIDRCYSKAINTSSHNGNFLDAVGRKSYIQQFLKEICQCAPTSVTITGIFFGDSVNYIKLAEDNTSFRHDLLIGADIVGANIDMGEIGRKAGLGRTQPIALIKEEQTTTPLVCTLDSSGRLENCYNPVEGGEARFARQKQQKIGGDNAMPTIALGVGAIAILIVIGIGAVLSRK